MDSCSAAYKQKTLVLMRTALQELTASVTRTIAQYHKEFLLDIINFRLFKFENSIKERSIPLSCQNLYFQTLSIASLEWLHTHAQQKPEKQKKNIINVVTIILNYMPMSYSQKYTECFPNRLFSHLFGLNNQLNGING